MSKLTKSWILESEERFNSSMLKFGEMMESVSGNILIKSDNRLIYISGGLVNWDPADGGRHVDIYGRKLLPGESITLTQE